jgi:DNA-binding LacI/PurR family transcriptional regulator
VDVGQRGASMILDAIENPDQELGTDILPATFIARDSVGPAYRP